MRISLQSVVAANDNFFCISFQSMRESLSVVAANENISALVVGQ
jgi:hypothetical protein